MEQKDNSKTIDITPNVISDNLQKPKLNFFQYCVNGIKKFVFTIQDFQDSMEQRRLLNKEKELRNLKNYNMKHAREQSLNDSIEQERKKKDKFLNKPKDSLFGEIKF